MDDLPRPLVVAHRAGNDRSTLGLSETSAADLIELDVHMTKDRQVVVRHGPFVGKGERQLWFHDRRWDEVRETAPDVLLLREVLEWAKSKGRGLMIDIKNGPVFYPQIHTSVARLSHEFELQDRVWVVSFDHRAIFELKQDKRFDVRAGILYVARLSHLKETIRLVGADLIETPTRFLTREIVDDAHKSGAVVASWSTDDHAEIEELLRLGVDMITTGVPRLARALVTARER